MASETKSSKGILLNKGAVKGGEGNYIFRLNDMKGIAAGGNYSTAVGPLVEGERTQVGLMKKSKGTGARPHTHPNEQWNYIVQGRLRVNINGKESIEGPGTLLFFPSNIVHSTVALPDEDVYFLVVKDTTHGIVGNPVEGEEQGAFYEEGFGPGERG